MNAAQRRHGNPWFAAGRMGLRVIPPICLCAFLIMTIFSSPRSHEASSGSWTKEQVATQDRLTTIRKLIYEFKHRTVLLPPSAQILQSVVLTTNVAVFVDGWGQPFRFLTNVTGSLTVYSLGADSKAGGVGINGDMIFNIDL